MKNKKKTASYFHYKYDKLYENIYKYKNRLNIPRNLTKKNNIKTHSWFNIDEFDISNNENKYNLELPKLKNVNEYINRRIRIYPTKKQKDMLLNWMDAYIDIYNATIKLFKKYRFYGNKITLQWKKIRTKYLKNVKKDIINKSQLSKYKSNTKVNSHVLDGAIQEACKNYKACLSNLKSGNIKHFRLRYIKHSKPSKIIKIEKYFISSKKNTFCSNIFSNNFKFSNTFKLIEHINCDFLIQYYKKTNKFFLINPIKNSECMRQHNKETISLDPGIRTFLTGFTNKKCVDICSNLKTKLKKYITKIDKVQNQQKHIFNKVNRHYYKKIKNVVDDMHYKVINYLTTNYGNIIIGNMSIQSIIKNKVGNNLNSKTKRLAQLMKLYTFKQRLKYKCSHLNIGYTEVDEAYTSKTCSLCGFENEKNSNKTFKCKCCRYMIDRDINGAKNIMYNAISFEQTFVENQYKNVKKEYDKLRRKLKKIRTKLIK